MKTILYILLLTTVIFGCTNKLNRGYTTAEHGVKYKLHRTTDTAYKLQYGDRVTLNVKVNDEEGNLLANINDSVGDRPIQVIVKEGHNGVEGNLLSILTNFKEGDSVSIKLTTAQFFDYKAEEAEYMWNKQEDDILIVNLGIVAVVSKAADMVIENRIRDSVLNDIMVRDSLAAAKMIERILKEGEQLKDYFKDKGITGLSENEHGTYYKITKHTDGRKAERHDHVSVEYNLYTLEDSIPIYLASIKGDPYTTNNLGVTDFKEIAGIDDVVLEMRVGEEAIVGIPSHKAFRDGTLNNTIPPNSIIIGTIKLIRLAKPWEE